MIAIEPVRQLGQPVIYVRGSTQFSGVSRLGQFGPTPTPALFARHAIENSLKTNRQLFERMGFPIPRNGSRSRIEAHPTLYDAVLRYALNWARITKYPRMYFHPTPKEKFIIRNADQGKSLSQAYLSNVLSTKYNFFRAAEYVRPPSVVTKRVTLTAEQERIKAQVARERAEAARIKQRTPGEVLRAGIIAQQQKALAIQQAQPAREAAIEAQKAEREVRWAAKEALWDEQERIEDLERAAQQAAKKRSDAVKRAEYEEKKRKAAIYNAQVREQRRVREAEQAAIKKAAAEADKQRRRLAQEQRIAEQLELVAAHPFRAGSPPISAAIAKLAAQAGITPGEMDPADFAIFRNQVYTEGRALRSSIYYHKPGGGAKKYMYRVDMKTVDIVLKQEGYTAMRPLVLPTPPTPPAVIQPTVAQPARLPQAYTTSPEDPMIQFAVEQVVLESGLQSGQEVRNIAAFQWLVAAKIMQLAPAAGRQARPVDITAAVDARLRFLLYGVAV